MTDTPDELQTIIEDVGLPKFKIVHAICRSHQMQAAEIAAIHTRLPLTLCRRFSGNDYGELLVAIHRMIPKPTATDRQEPRL